MLFIDKKTNNLLIISLFILLHNLNQKLSQIYTDFNKFYRTFEFFLENNVFSFDCLFLFQLISI